MSYLRYKRVNIESGRIEFHIFDYKTLAYRLYYSALWDKFVIYDIISEAQHGLKTEYLLEYITDIDSVYLKCPDFSKILIKNIDAISEMRRGGLVIEKEVFYNCILPEMEVMSDNEYKSLCVKYG